MEGFRFHPLKAQYAYDNPLSRQRANLLLVSGFVIIITSALTFALMLSRSSHNTVTLLVIMAPVWTVIGINIYLVQTGRLYIASTLFVFATMVGVGANMYSYGIAATTLMPLALGVVFAALLLGARGGAVTFLVGCAMTAVVAYLQAQGIVHSEYEVVGEAAYSLAELLIMFVVVVLSTSALEKALLRSTRAAAHQRATASVSTAISSTLALEALLRESAALIREQFGFYSVQIFLVTRDNTSAVLRAGTGRAGRRLLAQEYRLEVDLRTAVGRAILINEPVLISQRDSLFVSHPLLPDARAELALPLRVGDRVIGALDVQCTQADAFTEDIASLQALANQLAAGVENAAALETMRQQLAEKQQALDALRARLEEVEQTNRQLTGQVWARYLSGRGADAVGFDWDGDQMDAQTGWTSGMVAATSQGRVSLRQEGDRQVLTVPITMRGRALGAVELVNTPDRRWDEASVELAQEVVSRLAVSLETARLTEDAHRLAERERLVGQVSRNLQGKQEIAEVLSLASAEFHRALGATMTTVRLGGFEPEPANPR